MKKPAIKKKKPIIRTEYLRRVYRNDEYQEMISSALETVKKFQRKHPFDAIAFSGSSGAAIAYPLSYLMKIPLIHVRARRGHYDSGNIEGTLSAKRYLIVDDFIDEGRTMRRIISNIKLEINKDAKPVGIILYASDRLASFGKIPVVNVP